MKVHSSLGTKRKHAPNRADTILHPSINTLTASRSRVERVLVIDIGGRSVKILQPGKCKADRCYSLRSGSAPTQTVAIIPCLRERPEIPRARRGRSEPDLLRDRRR